MLRAIAGWSCLVAAALAAVATLRTVGPVGRLDTDTTGGLVVIALLVLSLAAVGLRLVLGSSGPAGGAGLSFLFGALGFTFGAVAVLLGASFAPRSLVAAAVSAGVSAALSVACFASAARRSRGRGPTRPRS